MLRRIFAREGLGVLYALPLAFVPVGLLLGPRRQPGVLLMLSLAMLAVVAVFYLPLLSVFRLHWSTSSSRFLLPVVLIALPVSMLWCRGFPRAGRVFVGAIFCSAAFYAIGFASFGWAPFESSLLISSFLVVAWTVAIRVTQPGRPWRAGQKKKKLIAP